MAFDHHSHPRPVVQRRQREKREHRRLQRFQHRAARIEGGPEQLLLADGMHLNDAGHKLIAESLLPLVRKSLATDPSRNLETIEPGNP